MVGHPPNKSPQPDILTNAWRKRLQSPSGKGPAFRKEASGSRLLIHSGFRGHWRGAPFVPLAVAASGLSLLAALLGGGPPPTWLSGTSLYHAWPQSV